MLVINKGNIQPFTREFLNYNFRDNKINLITEFHNTSRPQDIHVSFNIPNTVRRTGDIVSVNTNKYLNFNNSDINDYRNSEKINSLFNYKNYFSAFFNSEATDHYLNEVLTNEKSLDKDSYYYSPEFNNYAYFQNGRYRYSNNNIKYFDQYLYTFANYTNYKDNTIHIPNTVQVIQGAFQSCSCIDTVYIPNSVLTYASSVFMNSRIKNVIIEDNFFVESIDFLFRDTLFIQHLEFPPNIDYESAWYAFACSNIKFDKKYITQSLKDAPYMFEGTTGIDYTGELNLKNKKLQNCCGLFYFENYHPNYYYEHMGKNNIFSATKVIFPDTLKDAGFCFYGRKFNDQGTRVHFGNNVTKLSFAFHSTQNAIYYNGLIPNSVIEANALFNYATLHPNSENINYFCDIPIYSPASSMLSANPP